MEVSGRRQLQRAREVIIATPAKPLRVIGLKRTKYKATYSFGIAVSGFIWNGFTYNATSKSIKPPSLIKGGKRYPLVKGFGIAWKRLQALVSAELERIDDGATSSEEGTGS